MTTHPSLPKRFLSTACLSLLAASPVLAESRTSVSVGIDYVRGDYGSPDTTTTMTIPLSVKHLTGPWTMKASLPFVKAEGTFNRDLGFDDSGNLDDNGQPLGKRTESGFSDLTLAVAYTLVERPNGFALDLGGKAKIATGNKDKTLITSGENDYSVQVDAFQPLGGVAVFGTLGYTLKGEPAGASYSNPFYGSVGFSVPLSAGNQIGAAWDYREKITASGDPVSELSVFYSLKLDPSNKMQAYLIHGISDGSPDIGGGLVYSYSY